MQKFVLDSHVKIGYDDVTGHMRRLFFRSACYRSHELQAASNE